MIHFFLKYVVGGETGKRESAWFAFLLWLAATAWIGWAEFNTEKDLEGIRAMWMLVTPLVWAWLGASHGFDWVSKQTQWGATRISYETPCTV